MTLTVGLPLPWPLHSSAQGKALLHRQPPGGMWEDNFEGLVENIEEAMDDVVDEVPMEEVICGAN
jgi:hypothetical protein